MTPLKYAANSSISRSLRPLDKRQIHILQGLCQSQVKYAQIIWEAISFKSGMSTRLVIENVDHHGQV